jgi:hypothetical protein
MPNPSVAVFATVLGLCVAVSGRETQSFDVGWQFQLGDDGYDLPCNTSAFTTNLSGTFCTGATMVFVSSAELCESACCGNPDCTSWQYCEQPCMYVNMLNCTMVLLFAVCFETRTGQRADEHNNPPPMVQRVADVMCLPCTSDDVDHCTCEGRQARVGAAKTATTRVQSRRRQQIGLAWQVVNHALLIHKFARFVPNICS